MPKHSSAGSLPRPTPTSAGSGWKECASTAGLHGTLSADADNDHKIVACWHLAWKRDPLALAWLQRNEPRVPLQNAWSDFATWAKLDCLHLRHYDIMTHDTGEILDAISIAGGIPVEFAPNVQPRFRESRYRTYRVPRLGADPTALDVLVALGSMVMPDDRGDTTWILSNGRIRIVTEAEAERFWRESARR